MERTLVEAARATAARIWEGWFARDLIIEDGRCRGVTALDPGGAVVELRAAHTLLATGGAGQLYSVTTNPPQSSGDGVAMALRAGVPVADIEFVQFHPTALHGSTAGPRPLLSEALRGEGALLRDRQGRRFVDELQPRDVVAAAVAARMREDGVEHVWLDVSAVEGFANRFPTLAAVVRDLGLDPVRDWLPVAPAAHYLCGGALTDLDGATALPGAVGRGRDGLHRRARGQPAGVELAAGGHGVRRPGGRGGAVGKRGARRDRRPPPGPAAGRLHAGDDRRALAPRPAVHPRGEEPGGPGQGSRAPPTGHDPRRRGGAHSRVAGCCSRRDRTAGAGARRAGQPG